MNKIKDYSRIAIASAFVSVIITTISVVVIYYGVCWGFPECNEWIWDQIPILSRSLFVINWVYVLLIYWVFKWLWKKLEHFFDRKSAHRVASLISFVLVISFLLLQIFFYVMNLDAMVNS